MVVRFWMKLSLILVKASLFVFCARFSDNDVNADTEELLICIGWATEGSDLHMGKSHKVPTAA